MYINLIYLAIPVEIGPGAGQEASVGAGQRGLQPFLEYRDHISEYLN
jgi:hypothetical protein